METSPGLIILLATKQTSENWKKKLKWCYFFPDHHGVETGDQQVKNTSKDMQMLGDWKTCC